MIIINIALNEEIRLQKNTWIMIPLNSLFFLKKTKQYTHMNTVKLFWSKEVINSKFQIVIKLGKRGIFFY